MLTRAALIAGFAAMTTALLPAADRPTTPAFKSGRSATLAPNGMVATSHPLAAPTRAAGLLLLLTPVIWGATFPAAKVALRDVSPWTFVAWSRGLGLLAIVVVLEARTGARF
jgi:hypothetical protein